MLRQGAPFSRSAKRTESVMNRPPVARTTEGNGAGSLSRSQTAFLVAALVASVISFQLNATMLGPAIRDIDTELGTLERPGLRLLLWCHRVDQRRGGWGGGAGRRLHGRPLRVSLRLPPHLCAR